MEKGKDQGPKLKVMGERKSSDQSGTLFNSKGEFKEEISSIVWGQENT